MNAAQKAMAMLIEKLGRVPTDQEITTEFNGIGFMELVKQWDKKYNEETK